MKTGRPGPGLDRLAARHDHGRRDPDPVDLGGWSGPVTVEVLVLNTLGPQLDGVSPTPYVFLGRRAPGLLGPVRLLAGA